MQDSNGPSHPDDPSFHEVQSRHLSARVPESVRRGVFGTGAIVITGPAEFVVDFVQNIGAPATIVARAIVPHPVMPQLIDALRSNWDLYVQRFGVPAEPPRGAPDPNQRRPTVQELYDELKIPDELLSGAYSNGLMIAHNACEFKLDFLTNMYPHSAVSCRVFLSALQIPRLIDSLHATFVQFQQRIAQQRRPSEEGEPPPKDPPGR
ncbi:MAG: DUF3467 domain-containing protein [Planctomycetes bacterium]|nr:DUF3467 domain-containing protein [Planctomycetota bacterium]